MNLCLNAFVIQFPDGLLDTCSVTAPRALLLPYAHRGHCKDEDSYKECSSHVEFSIGLTRRAQPPLWQRGCATVENTLIKIDIDTQRQRAVGWSDWLDGFIATGKRHLVACRSGAFCVLQTKSVSVSMMIVSPVSLSADSTLAC